MTPDLTQLKASAVSLLNNDYLPNDYRGWMTSALALLEDVARLQAQLPDGMQDCSIRFLECPEGHGRLTATNWLPSGCLHCELATLKGENERLKREMAIDAKFYQVTVAQRDSAWREVEELKAALTAERQKGQALREKVTYWRDHSRRSAAAWAYKDVVELMDTLGLAIPAECPTPTQEGKCANGHVWSNQFGEDWTPDFGTPCDCGQKQWSRR